MEQNLEPFVECSCSQHSYRGSPHPKNRVPRELFFKEGRFIMYKQCRECRAYKIRSEAKGMEKKRKAIENATDEFKCIHCGSMRNADICEGCVKKNVKKGKLTRENYAKVILERVEEMGHCCVDCKKVFLRSPNGVGFLTVESMDGVNLQDIEWRNLEFDHLNMEEQMQEFGEFRGLKHRGVGAKQSYASQKHEASKCLLRCISCHRRKTQQRSTCRPKVYKRRRPLVIEKKSEVVKQRKIEIGKCEECKAPVDPTNLSYFEFDHIDPLTKTRAISELAMQGSAKFTMELLERELSLCRLVCAFCHRLRTKEQILERHESNREKKRKRAKVETQLQDEKN